MSRSQSIRFEITPRTLNGSTVYEAVALIPGFGPAAVEKIEGGTQFSTRSAVTYTCNNRATSLGMTSVISYTDAPTATATTETTRTNTSRKTVNRVAKRKTTSKRVSSTR
jgi:hypothetical protein